MRAFRVKGTAGHPFKEKKKNKKKSRSIFLARQSSDMRYSISNPCSHKKMQYRIYKETVTEASRHLFLFDYTRPSGFVILFITLLTSLFMQQVSRSKEKRISTISRYLCIYLSNVYIQYIGPDTSEKGVPRLF